MMSQHFSSRRETLFFSEKRSPLLLRPRALLISSHPVCVSLRELCDRPDWCDMRDMLLRSIEQQMQEVRQRTIL